MFNSTNAQKVFSAIDHGATASVAGQNITVNNMTADLDQVFELFSLYRVLVQKSSVAADGSYTLKKAN